MGLHNDLKRLELLSSMMLAHPVFIKLKIIPDHYRDGKRMVTYGEVFLEEREANVFINPKTFYNKKNCFQSTLIHELGHIWIYKSNILLSHISEEFIVDSYAYSVLQNRVVNSTYETPKNKRYCKRIVCQMFADTFHYHERLRTISNTTLI